MSFPVAHVGRAVAFPGILNEFIGDDLVPNGAALPASERADVDEHPATPSIRGDEAEAPIVVPVRYSSLMAHG